MNFFQDRNKIQIARNHRAKKETLRFNTHYPFVGDTVLYECYTKKKVFVGSGIGTVLDIKQYYSDKMRVKYTVQDNTTNEVYEVMYNVHVYPLDTVVLLTRREKTMFYSGYDKLTNQIIPNTLGKFKTDTEQALVSKLGVDWKKENSFIEIRLVEVTLKD